MQPFKNWALKENKQYLDKFDVKKYYEYVLESTNGTEITLLICDYYEKKRVNVQVIYNSNGDKKYGWFPMKFGVKQIKKICDKSMDIGINDSEIKAIDGFNNKDKLFNETVLREMIDHFYNNNTDLIV